MGSVAPSPPVLVLPLLGDVVDPANVAAGSPFAVFGQPDDDPTGSDGAEAAGASGPRDREVVVIPFGRPGSGFGSGAPPPPRRWTLERRGYNSGDDPVLDVAAARLGASISDALIVVGEQHTFRDHAPRAIISAVQAAGIDDRFTALSQIAAVSSVGAFSQPVAGIPSPFEFLTLTPNPAPLDAQRQYHLFSPRRGPTTVVTYRSIHATPIAMVPASGRPVPERYDAWRWQAWRYDLRILRDLLSHSRGDIFAGRSVHAAALSLARSTAIRLEAEARERGMEATGDGRLIFNAAWVVLGGLQQYAAEPVGFDVGSFDGDYRRFMELYRVVEGLP